MSHRLILIYATSGAGKTSIFNAKVISTLENFGFDVLPLARVQDTSTKPTTPPPRVQATPPVIQPQSTPPVNKTTDLRSHTYEGMSVDLSELTQEIVLYFQRKGFKVEFSRRTPDQFNIQAMKAGIARKVSGFRRSAKIIITGNPQKFQINLTTENKKNLAVSVPLSIATGIYAPIAAASVYHDKKFRDDFWEFVNNEIHALSRESQIKNFYIWNAIQSLNTSDSDSLRTDLFLFEFLDANFPNSKGKNGEIKPQVLIFDQLEELFTSYPHRWTDQQYDFFEQVSDSLENNPVLRIVFIIREDFLAQIDPFKSILPGHSDWKDYVVRRRY